MGCVDVFGRFPWKDTKFFQDALQKANSAAPTPGVFSPAAACQYGACSIPHNGILRYAHLHQTLDGSGTNTVELWRRRAGAMTRIGTVTLVLGGGDLTVVTFALTNPYVLAGDYLYMQATQVAVGGTPVGTVDCHLEYLS